MRVTVASAAAVLALSLAACTAPTARAPDAAVAPTPALASAPVGSNGVDGVYRAPPGGAAGNSACGTTRFGYPIRVVNGAVSMQTVSAGQLTGSVAPDGSLVIESGRAMLRGQFSGDQFNGTYSNGRCGFALAYKK